MRLVYVSLAVLLAACHGQPATQDGPDEVDTDGTDPLDTDTMSGEATVGPEGGVIRLSGLELMVPPGALATPTAIQIERLAQSPRPDQTHSGAYEFLPTGLQFALPAHLTLRTDGTPGVEVRWSADGRRFTSLPTLLDVDQARADISHFSFGFAGTAPATDTAVLDTDDSGRRDSAVVGDTDLPDTDVADTDVADTDTVQVDTGGDTDLTDTDTVQVDTGGDTDLTDTDTLGVDTGGDTDVVVVVDTDVADTDVVLDSSVGVDTDVADTDVADTDVADTDVADTDRADTDVIVDTDTALPPIDTDPGGCGARFDLAFGDGSSTVVTPCAERTVQAWVDFDPDVPAGLSHVTALFSGYPSTARPIACDVRIDLSHLCGPGEYALGATGPSLAVVTTDCAGVSAANEGTREFVHGYFRLDQASVVGDGAALPGSSEQVTVVGHLDAWTSAHDHLVGDFQFAQVVTLGLEARDCTVASNLCGDGVVRGGEGCDDANPWVGDGCDLDCVVETCGNGVLQFGEQCDDGNLDFDDGCDPGCVVEFCGDGVQQADEGCDDGGTAPDDGCGPTCAVERCGDAILQLGETCDDGNTGPDDGCGPTCQTERCGDGITQANEECDDGGNAPGDGCSAECRFEDCGDLVIENGELCDDGSLDCTHRCATPSIAELSGDPATGTIGSYGRSVSLSGDLLVVGAPTSTVVVSGTSYAALGLVDVWRRSQGGWVREATLKPPTAVDNDQFGSAVATNGTVVVVSDASLRKVYLYELVGNVWTLTDTESQASTTTKFGATLAWSGDRLLVGEPDYTGSRSLSGAILAYEYSASGLTFVTRVEGPYISGHIGSKLAVSGARFVTRSSGNFISNVVPGLIGSPTALTLLPNLGLPSTASSVEWGSSLAIDGDRLFVGDSTGSNSSDSIFVFSWTGSTWSRTGSLTKQRPLSLSDDLDLGLAAGNGWVVNGAGTLDSVQTPYKWRFVLEMWKWSGVEWQPSGGAYPTDGRLSLSVDNAATVASVSGDTAAVGRTNEGVNGAVWVYELTAGSCGDGDLVPATETCDDGNTVGDDGCDASCRVECGNGIQEPHEGCDDHNVKADDGCGPTCVVEYCGDGITQPSREECDDANGIDDDGCDSGCLRPTPAFSLVGAVSNDQVGVAVDIDVTHAVIASPARDLVRVVEFNGASWSEGAPLVAPVSSGTFGRSVAVSGDWMWVGAPGETVSSVAGAGVARRYHFDGTAWVLDGTSLGAIFGTASSGNWGTALGTSIAMEGNLAAIGRPTYRADVLVSGTPTTLYNTGSVTVWVYDGVAWQGNAMTGIPNVANTQVGLHVGVAGDCVFEHGAGGTAVYWARWTSGVTTDTAVALTPPASRTTAFGDSLQGSGDRIAISDGPGLTWIYVDNGVTWSIESSVPFGTVVDLDGDDLVVANNAGGYTVLHWDGASWLTVAVRVDPRLDPLLKPAGSAAYPVLAARYPWILGADSLWDASTSATNVGRAVIWDWPVP